LKILLLSDANSIHTYRWAYSLKKRGIDIKLFSLFKPNKFSVKKYNECSVEVISTDLKSKIKDLRKPNLSKIRYIQSIRLIKKTIKFFEPDIVHSHYSSSYGVLGMLSGFRPIITSVWGSDIYSFPNKNRFNKILTKLVFKNSNKVCSTSKAMKKIIKNEFNISNVDIIPFGIDLTFFDPNPNYYLKQNFTVGTIKSIEDHNGIDCLLDAAWIIKNEYKVNLNFIIVGDGSLKKEMEKKSIELELDNIEFTGHVDHQEVKKYYEMISIFIAVSTRESFGVSVLEAAANAIPSITSNIGGLTEVNLHNKTGIVIDPNDPEKLASSIIKLYRNKKLLKKLGKNARGMVQQNFDWNDNVCQMLKLYNTVLN